MKPNELNSYLNLLPVELQNKLSNLEFYYEGFHNITFKGMYLNENIQLRIPKNKIKVDNEIEAKVLATQNNVLYYKNGVLVKKWFNGKTCEEVSLCMQKKNKIINKVIEFQNLNIDLPTFDYFYYGKGTKKYQTLVKKLLLRINEFKPSHGDLAAKNILIDNKYNVELIDFEWSRLNHPLFDAISLYKNLDIDLTLIKRKWKYDDESFNEMIYIYDEFNKYCFEKTYSKFLSNFENFEQITIGKTNKSYRYNDYFIQEKQLNGFNFQNNISLFNNYDISSDVVYENDNMYVRKFINNKRLKFDDVNLKRIGQLINKFQNINIAIKDYSFKKRLEEMFLKLPKELIYSYIDKQLINQIFNNIENSELTYLSHNDLNDSNILLSKSNHIKFIDLEYVAYNHKYFDLAYFASSTNLDENQEKILLNSYNDNIEWNEYFKIKCIANFYGLIWTLNLKDQSWDININLENIRKYQKYLKK